MRALLFRWHRRLALVIAIPVMAWVISGLTHPLMAHVWVPSLASSLVELPRLADAPENTVSPADLLATHGLDAVDQINLIAIDGHWYWQTVRYLAPLAGSARREAMPNGQVELSYFDAQSAERIEGAEQRHAVMVARQLSGVAQGVTSVQRLTEFDRYYRGINRVLPVHRVSVEREDAPHLYIDLIGQRLITVDNRWRRVGMWMFARFHNWDFLGDRHSPARLLPITLLVGLSLAVGLGGLTLYVLQWRARRGRSGRAGVPRWHRRAGLLFAITTIGFATSGLHVALGQFEREDHFAWRANTQAGSVEMPVHPLQHVSGSVVALSHAWLDDELYWQMRYRDQDNLEAIDYVSAMTGKHRESGDQDYARIMLHDWYGDEIVVARIGSRQRFGMDYPAVYKRLPVQRLGLEHEKMLTLFVETHTGHIANLATHESKLRGMHFMYLHKYHLFDGLGAKGRDLVMALAALGAMLIVLLGLLAWRQSVKKSAR